MSIRQYSNEMIQIRKLRPEDLPGLEWGGELAHFRNIFSQTYQQYQTGEAVMWVAEHPPTGIIAQVFIQLGKPSIGSGNGDLRVYLFGFRVREAYRNLGLGSRILKMVEEDLKQQGYRWVTLNVSQDNPAARRLYERFGYRVVGVEPGRWSYIDHQGRRIQVNEPAFRMEKKLDSGE
jgi:ribosomal protein S18 acetylase RimI-like enzyme